MAANDKLFEKLIGNSSVNYTYIEYSSYYGVQTRQGNTNLSFADVEKSVDPTTTYRERLEALRTTFEELASSDILDVRKEDIRSQTLSQLMDSIDYGSHEKYKALKVPRLIEFLVVKGYIDENYYDYISYFYDNFVDAHDWDFVLDLKLGKVHPYDYHINSVESCLKEIPSSVYRKNAILNICILDYLAEHSSDRLNITRLLVVLRTVVEAKKYDFLVEFFQKGKFQDVVFMQLFAQYKDLWDVFDVYDDANYSLKLVWYKYAEKGNSCENSQKWLSKNYDFITGHMLDISEEQWIELIGFGNYHFTDLDGKSEKILKTVVTTNSYELTRHNLEILVACLLDMSIDSVSYRLVVDTECEELIDRVEENLGKCLQSVFSAPAAENEDEETIHGILLTPQVPDELKIEYLQKQQNKIDLGALEQNDVKRLAIKCDVIKSTWENIIHYMNHVSEQKTDDELIAFIERHVDELADINVPQESNDDEQMLFRQLILTDRLAFGAYCKIVDLFTRCVITGVVSIEERRVLLLIEKGMIKYQERNTTDLLSNYSGNAVVSYLIKNKRDFLVKPETVEYTTEVATNLMKSNLSNREKLTIIPCFKKDILDMTLANEVMVIIADQKPVVDAAFVLKAMSLSDKTEEKFKVLNDILEKNNLGENTITLFLKTLPSKYKEIGEKGKKPEVPNSPGARRLVEILKEKNYISSYSESTNGIRVNTKLK